MHWLTTTLISSFGNMYFTYSNWLLALPTCTLDAFSSEGSGRYVEQTVSPNIITSVLCHGTYMVCKHAIKIVTTGGHLTSHYGLAVTRHTKPPKPGTPLDITTQIYSTSSETVANSQRLFCCCGSYTLIQAEGSHCMYI